MTTIDTNNRSTPTSGVVTWKRNSGGELVATRDRRTVICDRNLGVSETFYVDVWDAATKSASRVPYHREPEGAPAARAVAEAILTAPGSVEVVRIVSGAKGETLAAWEDRAKPKGRPLRAFVAQADLS